MLDLGLLSCDNQNTSSTWRKKGKRVLKVSILVVILALVIGASLMFRKGNAGPIVQKELTHQQFNQIDTSNGSVVVRNSVAQGYDLDTSNGRITVNGQDEGDTYSQNDVGDNVLEIDTSNGNITVN